MRMEGRWIRGVEWSHRSQTTGSVRTRQAALLAAAKVGLGVVQARVTDREPGWLHVLACDPTAEQ